MKWIGLILGIVLLFGCGNTASIPQEDLTLRFTATPESYVGIYISEGKLVTELVNCTMTEGTETLFNELKSMVDEYIKDNCEETRIQAGYRKCMSDCMDGNYSTRGIGDACTVLCNRPSIQ